MTRGGTMGTLSDALGQSISPCMQIWRRYIWHFLVLYVILLGVVLLTLASKLNGEDPVSVRGVIYCYQTFVTSLMLIREDSWSL
ncbi:hypothetical protein BDV36DRAFT_144135 [Aspergillus pseudocaelatus]|uniref:CDR ABC transporter domain-containing protein n=1 Tax=Aspergillus pseudocaelatus TaxID=1825620 RepID=A0ABQ6WPS3_9EURO|nr:hypothetical protein BDV36DRAFT_144135 [Aspergillus pseudocaelatus]